MDLSNLRHRAWPGQGKAQAAGNTSSGERETWGQQKDEEQTMGNPQEATEGELEGTPGLYR